MHHLSPSINHVARASKYMASSVSRAGILQLSCLRQSRQSCQPVLALAHGFKSSTRGFDRSEHVSEIRKAPVRLRTVFIIGAGLAFVGYITVRGCHDWYENHRIGSHASVRESAIFKTLKKGSKPDIITRDFIPREELLKSVSTIIAPTEDHRLYPIIIGEHGTGKTNLIGLALNELNNPKGVVYVNVHHEDEWSSNEFVRPMQQALGVKPDPIIDSQKPSFRDTWVAFSDAAVKYRRKYGKIPVLIVDNADKLSSCSLDQLQDAARRAADDGTATVVFVLSGSSVPRRMMERSSWSRHGVILEIGDVSKEEALGFLRLRKIADRKLAEQIYNLVGGRVIHLLQVAEGLENHIPFQGIRQALLGDAKAQLECAGVLQPESAGALHGDFYQGGAMVIRELVKKHFISEDAYYRLVGHHVGKKQLEANILSHDFASGRITFQSTLMRRYCELNAAYWKR